MTVSEKAKRQQEADRKEILELVGRYTEKYHTPKDYLKGDNISYAGRVFDKSEVISLVDSALDFWLTAGRYTEEFEKALCEYLDIQFCSFVNSGSSANLLAFMTLTSPLLGERAIKPGDEVITVAAGFPTTIAPMIQYGAEPVFVDITIPQYNIDTEMMEKALSSKTKAVMIAHTLGNPFDLQKVKEFCCEHGLWLIEDNCDALGSQCMIDGVMKKTGTVGDIGTSSFYPPHHITTGEGGAVYTDNPLLNRIMRSIRDWGRDCSCPSGRDNLCGHRFDGQYGELPKGYDHKYVYSHFGYNLKATDMQAAIGVEQLKKLPEFTRKRRKNFEKLKDGLKSLEGKLILPEPFNDSEPSWFGFMMTCREDVSREKLVRHLERNGIQTRMLFSGNIIKQPCFNEMREKQKGYRVVGNLDNTDRVMENSFWIGLYPGMTDEMLEYMIEKIKEYFN